MSSTKWKILFKTKENSQFDVNSPAFEKFFKSAYKTTNIKEVQELIQHNSYDMIISDISLDAFYGGIELKEMIEKDPSLTIFALLTPRDSDKLLALSEMGINAFELIPEQLDLALEEISKFNPHKKA
jgi:DNA-binding NtrC family response regulator